MDDGQSQRQPIAANPFFLINAITAQRNSALDTAAFWQARAEELGASLNKLSKVLEELKASLEVKEE